VEGWLRRAAYGAASGGWRQVHEGDSRRGGDECQGWPGARLRETLDMRWRVALAGTGGGKVEGLQVLR
jgi:hypothetical protein